VPIVAPNKVVPRDANVNGCPAGNVVVVNEADAVIIARATGLTDKARVIADEVATETVAATVPRPAT